MKIWASPSKAGLRFAPIRYRPRTKLRQKPISCGAGRVYKGRVVKRARPFALGSLFLNKYQTNRNKLFDKRHKSVNNLVEISNVFNKKS